MCVFVDFERVVCEGDITGKRKCTECQASHKVGLFCLLDYLEYATRVFVCLSLGGFKVDPTGNTAQVFQWYLHGLKMDLDRGCNSTCEKCEII